MFEHDYTGVNERGQGFDPIPEGDYNFVITKTQDQKTSNKDNMVNVTCKVADGPYAGRLVWHNVVFLPKAHKAAGMSKHFLHVINQPFEGVVTVDSKNWIDEVFRAHVKIAEFNGKPKNEIDEVYAQEEYPSDAGSPEGDSMEEVPF